MSTKEMNICQKKQHSIPQLPLPKSQKPPNKKHHHPKKRRRAPNEDPIDFIESDEPTEAADDNDEEDAGDDATGPPPEVKQKFTLKVDGKEEEVELDRRKSPSPSKWQQPLKRGLPSAKAIQKQATDFIHLVQTDPLKILKNPKLGIDFDKLSQDYLYEKFQLANMTPEQKEAHELKQDLEALRHEKKQQAETAEAADLQKQTAHYEERYNNEYEEAIGIANLPIRISLGAKLSPRYRRP